MSNAYLYRMPSGVPGDVTRRLQSTIEPVPLDPKKPFNAFGVFGKIAGGKFVPLESGDKVDRIYGLNVRPYPTTGGADSDPLGTSTPMARGMGDALRRGYMAVRLNAGAAAFNKPVYVRVSAAAPGKPIGGIEAAEDGANTALVPRCTFMCAADERGNVEICLNI